MAIKKHISEIADSAYKSDLSFDVITFECAVPDKKNVTAFTASIDNLVALHTPQMIRTNVIIAMTILFLMLNLIILSNL